MIEALRRWLQSYGWEIENVADGPDGRLFHGRVQIRTDLTPELELVVLLHEGAHVLLDHQAPVRRFDPFAHGRKEVSAETVAQLAARILGVDTSVLSKEFLAQFPGVQPEPRVGLVARTLADHVKEHMR